MKLCTKCHTEKDESEFGKFKDSYNGNSVYYQEHYCLDCKRAYQRAWNKKKRDSMPSKPPKPAEVVRICNDCGFEKTVEHFGKHRKRICKQCLCKRSKANYIKKSQTNEFKEANRKRVKEWRDNNLERSRAKCREFNSSEHYKKRRRKKYQATKYFDKDLQIVRSKKYNKQNIDSLSDHYIICQLEKDGVDRDVSKSHPELIEIKRQMLTTKRLLTNKIINYDYRSKLFAGHENCS